MRFYAIQDEASGKYLPNRKGYSYSNTTSELTDEEPPRLFTKKGPARQAANCWQAGILTPALSDADLNISFDDHVVDKVSDKQVHGKRMQCFEIPARKALKLNIVPVDITFADT